MADIIKLLPDSIANQIAAGEVIQRPASVVKELLENAVDAGATAISVIIGDSGKSLIQVVDNGSGMSEMDARMSLERHATSKISSVDDLFKLRTKGFRGEALASIAAVAQMEIKTRTEDRELGTCLIVEGSKVKSQSVCATPVGTSVSVRNLFFNVPARRKFLKKDAVEMHNVVDEFERVALVHENVEFKMFHNKQQLFSLPESNVRQRIIGILGKAYNEKLVPVEENTDLVKLNGFIGKPEAARKIRGEQFLFVNGRFFKSSYLHAAIQQAFEGLIPKGYHPAYFIYFTVAPSTIDVNIHPTKTEIKFEDERSMFAILRSAVKRSLGQHHIAPSLDFEREAIFDIPPPQPGQSITPPSVAVNPNYNPFEVEKQRTQKGWERGNVFQKQQTTGWETLYQGLANDLKQPIEISQTLEFEAARDKPTLVRQIGGRYILVQSNEGVFLLHQYRAHTRVLFEAFEDSAAHTEKAVQQLIFPHTMEFSPQDAVLFKLLIGPLAQIGFEVEEFGGNAFIVRSVPAACNKLGMEECIAGFMDDLRSNKPTSPDEVQKSVTRAMAQHAAIKSGVELKAEEMLALFEQLMRCRQPQYDLKGRLTFILINPAMLDNLFSA